MLKASPSDRNFIVITFLLVVMLGGSTFASLVQEDDDASSSVAEMHSTPAGRAPASIPSAMPMKKSLSHLVDMDLSCAAKKSIELKVSGSFLQLKGKNCLKNFKQDRMQIVNQSNGFTASFFEYGSGQYQTDLIQLKEGENQITIRYQSSGNAIEQVLKVTASAI